MTEASVVPEEGVAEAAAAAVAAEEADLLTLEELADLCEQRGSIYSFLARLFRVEVDEELLSELKEMRFPANTGSDEVDAGYRALSSYIASADSHAITDLAVDYTQTFIGHGVDSHSAAYPYESVYVSPKRLLMQEARDEVLAIYRSESLDKIDSWKEPEDHVALELEFLAFLCAKATEAAQAGNEEELARLLTVQRNFLHDHLLAWAFAFGADIQEFSKTQFYKGLGCLLVGFLKLEDEYLNELLED